MRVVSGRADDPETDQRRTREMADVVAATGEPALRVWTPHRQVAFGRRDRRSDGYERAEQLAREHNYAVTERDVGGRAVAFTGQTVAFSLAESVEDHREGIQERYDRTLDGLQTALQSCGIDATPGEPPNSFCPGSHSLQTSDGKVVGVAQRVRQDVAVVGGMIVCDGATLVAILAPVYDALGVPFDPASVGTLPSIDNPTVTNDPTTTGDSTTTDQIRDAVESAFTDENATSVTQVRET